MKLVDLAITNTSKTESFDVLGVVIPKNETVQLVDEPFNRANALVIAASGIPALDVTVKGMASTEQGLITNELATLRKDNADLKQQVSSLTATNDLSAATITEQGLVINLLTAQKAELQRQLDEALASAPETLPASAAKASTKAAKTKGATK